MKHQTLINHNKINYCRPTRWIFFINLLFKIPILQLYEKIKLVIGELCLFFYDYTIYLYSQLLMFIYKYLPEDTSKRDENVHNCLIMNHLFFIILRFGSNNGKK